MNTADYVCEDAWMRGKEGKRFISTHVQTHLLLENLDLLFLLSPLLCCHDSCKSQVGVVLLSTKVAYKAALATVCSTNLR